MLNSIPANTTRLRCATAWLPPAKVTSNGERMSFGRVAFRALGAAPSNFILLSVFGLAHAPPNGFLRFVVTKGAGLWAAAAKGEGVAS